MEANSSSCLDVIHVTSHYKFHVVVGQRKYTRMLVESRCFSHNINCFVTISFRPGGAYRPNILSYSETSSNETKKETYNGKIANYKPVR